MASAETFSLINEGLDHALALLLRRDDFPLKLGVKDKSPYACYKQIYEVSEQRQQKSERRQAKNKLGKAKLKLAKHEEEEEEEEEEGEEGEENEDDVDIPMRIVNAGRPEPVKKKEKEKGGKAKAEPEPKVKKLDLSGVDLSPVMLQPKSQPMGATIVLPPSRPATTIPICVATVEVNRPLTTASAPLAPAADTLQRLQRLPMLENLVAGSTKHTKLVKWIESEDGKNRDVSKALQATVNRLQKNGRGVTSNNGKAVSLTSPRRSLSLSSETLDDRLKLEGHVDRKRKLRVKREEKAVKGEKDRPRKLTTRAGEARMAGRKRPLNGFVVESDEDENELAGVWEGDDSEAEYESGDEESSEEEEEEEIEMRLSNFDAAVEGKRSTEKSASSPTGSGRNGMSPSPAASTKSSPRTASTHSSQEAPAAVGAAAQLAQVVARIRADEEEEAAGVESTPTYLSYDKPSAAPGPVMKQEQKRPVTPKAASSKPLAGVDGTSESNAIVLDDSDDDDDDEEEEEDSDDYVPDQRVAPSPPAKKEPKAKHQVKTPPKTPPKPAKPRTKQVLKSSASKPPNSGKAPIKQKAKAIEDEEESEAEFVGMEDDGSSTDVDNEVFDLNEDDVYVVESILQIKRGRTSLTNSGRTTKEADLFLVKWEGYDELTWEPDANIPKRLIHFFVERETAKRECKYQIKDYLERRVVKNVTTGKDEIIYRIRWENVENAYWEVKTNLPDKTVVWLEKTNRSSGGGALSGPSKKKAKK